MPHRLMCQGRQVCRHDHACVECSFREPFRPLNLLWSFSHQVPCYPFTKQANASMRPAQDVGTAPRDHRAFGFPLQGYTVQAVQKHLQEASHIARNRWRPCEGDFRTAPAQRPLSSLWYRNQPQNHQPLRTPHATAKSFVKFLSLAMILGQDIFCKQVGKGVHV